MSTTANTTTSSTPGPKCERAELAHQLYREFHARCFWHSPRDLVITVELIPFVVKGLRTYGGRRGFILAEQLRPGEATVRTSERECTACR